VTVYLDHAASAPVRPEAAAAHTDALAHVGNPASVHAAGREVRARLEGARERLAAALDAHPTEVVFTAGGTEAVNLAIKGLAWRGLAAGRHRVLGTRAEHAASLDTLEWLDGRGHGGRTIQVEYAEVDETARVRLAALIERIIAGGPRDVALVSLLWAQNELGSIERVDAIADRLAELGVPLHWDAVAAVGRVPVRFRETGATALSLSGHKLGAPIGTGALLVRRGHEPEALLHGGAQQPGRSGTVDVAGAAALAVAVELAVAELEAESARLRELGERLRAGILAADPSARLSGPSAWSERLPGHVHVTFPGLVGETLLFVLDQAGFSVSVGSACRAGVNAPSEVLLAAGRDPAAARSGLRVTLGRTSTDDEVTAFLAALPGALELARAAS